MKDDESVDEDVPLQKTGVDVAQIGHLSRLAEVLFGGRHLIDQILD